MPKSKLWTEKELDEIINIFKTTDSVKQARNKIKSIKFYERNKESVCNKLEEYSLLSSGNTSYENELFIKQVITTFCENFDKKRRYILVADCFKDTARLVSPYQVKNMVQKYKTWIINYYLKDQKPLTREERIDLDKIITRSTVRSINNNSMDVFWNRVKTVFNTKYGKNYDIPFLKLNWYSPINENPYEKNIQKIVVELNNKKDEELTKKYINALKELYEKSKQEESIISAKGSNLNL